MNCYYGNFIEGNNSHPVDIERALKNDYSDDWGAGGQICCNIFAEWIFSFRKFSGAIISEISSPFGRRVDAGIVP